MNPLLPALVILGLGLLLETVALLCIIATLREEPSCPNPSTRT